MVKAESDNDKSAEVSDGENASKLPAIIPEAASFVKEDLIFPTAIPAESSQSDASGCLF